MGRSILNSMFTLIFAIIFGLGLAFFALQNTTGVTINLASMPFKNTPLWVVVVISLLIGLVGASYFNVLNILTSALKLRSKDTTIRGADKEIADLKEEIQRLKVENASLRPKKDSS